MYRIFTLSVMFMIVAEMALRTWKPGGMVA